MKSLFTKERPKTNEERLYDWKQRKRGDPSKDPNEKLLHWILGVAIVGIILSVINIMYTLSSSVQVVYPLIP